MTGIHALTAEDVPPAPTAEATAPACADHPDAGSLPGMGYAGGGFGSYRRCIVCDKPFGKVTLKDGNEDRDRRQ